MKTLFNRYYKLNEEYKTRRILEGNEHLGKLRVAEIEKALEAVVRKQSYV